MTTPFGKAVRHLRDRKGVSQKAMAAALGVSPAYLSALEHGRRDWRCRTSSAPSPEPSASALTTSMANHVRSFMITRRRCPGALPAC